MSNAMKFCRDCGFVTPTDDFGRCAFCGVGK